MEIGEDHDPYGAVTTGQPYEQPARQAAPVVGAAQPLVQDKEHNLSIRPGCSAGLRMSGKATLTSGLALEDHMRTTRGVLFVHSAPAALCPHIEWAIGGLVGARIHLDWTAQPIERAAYRTEYSWAGPVGTGARLASALTGWKRLRYEVTEEPTATSQGERYAYTPALGVFYAITGMHGDILIAEDRIRHAMLSADSGGPSLREVLDGLLGKPWDDELEPFRYAGEDAPVRWLHQVV